MQGIDRLRRAVLDRVGDCDDRGQDAIDGGIEGRLAIVAQPLGHIGKLGDLDAGPGHGAIGTDQDLPAGHSAGDPEAGIGGEVDHVCGL